MRIKSRLWFFGVLALLLPLIAACGAAVQSQPATTPEAMPTQEASAMSDATPVAEATPTPEATPTAMVTPTAAPLLDQADPPEFQIEQRQPGINTSGWKTDFSQRSVPYTEFISGGPPKDGIPSIDNPKFVSVVEADQWLADTEPVQMVDINGDARAFPLQILIWHEIVNDVIGDRPIAVTYCPLCNTALVFDATLPDGRSLDFGVSGKLRFSDLVMYDRQTESWWQQATGEAIVGELTGARLEFISSPIVSWAEFKTARPNGKVLSRDTGFSRSYGENPYTGYDSGQPWLFRGPEDDRLRATERVATVSLGNRDVAFPFSVLEQEPVVHYQAGDTDIVVFYQKGTASALDSGLIANGRDVGSTGVFIPEVNGQPLTFEMRDGQFQDRETSSTWNLLGEAVAGQLKGETVEPVVHGNHFWFSWAVFKPDTIIYRGN
jgi:hypothetical protein